MEVVNHMYLFKDKEEIEIPYTCKLCLKEFKFKITKQEYRDTTKFPIVKKIVHGEPEHELIVYFNQYLEVENFEIKELPKEAPVSYSEELTRQVLGELGLNETEIELYFKITGREAVSIGEMALLINRPKEECEKIAKKFVEKGLFKEIIGAKPHYTALPPYAALVSQLKKFHEYISHIKEKLPAQLTQSFKKLEVEAEKLEKTSESSELISKLKDSMLSQIHSQKKEFEETMAVMDQIKNITEEISSLEGYTEKLMTTQASDLSKQFEDINERTNKIIKEQVQQLKDQFSNIKSTVSENLQKLRLGVIRQAVDQMIEKIVDKRLEDIVNNVNIQLSVKQFALTDELKKFSQGLNAQVLEKLRESIKNTLNNLKGLKLKKDEDKDKIYETLTEDFDKAVKLAEERIENISGGVFEWFGNIRNIFSEQIVSTLETTLNDILKKLEVSEKVTKEFWEQAKQRTGLTMKDIWFIRSMESAKAHINEEITKAKMRVLIIAPNITDINIDAIKSRPSHINFRIATYFDLTNPKHAKIITELDKLDNVDYRFRHLQNLWGINRDYEEVIVCVLSKAEIRGETVIEIAGIGSIIEEHIKIFVPILEEAWMNAKKEIIHSIKSTLTKTIEPSVPEIEKKPEIKPKEVEPKIETPSVPEQVEEPSKAPTPPSHAIPTTEPETIKIEPKIKIPAEELKPGKEIEAIEKEIPPVKETAIIDTEAGLKEQFQSIYNNIENLTGIELSRALDMFQSEYIKKEGYSSVLKNIQATSLALKGKNYILSQPEKEDLKRKMLFWKQKFNFN